MKAIISISIDKNLIELFLSKKLTDEFVRKFYILMREKTNPSKFSHNNKEPFNKNVLVSLEKSLFSIKKVVADLNSLEIEDIIEKAAIGFTLAYFLKFRSNISDIEVLLRGDGYDYKWKEDDLTIKLEISGVNKKDSQTYNKRVYSKKNKFKNKLYNSPADEELISVIDFYHLRYKLWNVR